MGSTDMGRASEELLDILFLQLQWFDSSRHDWLMYKLRINLRGHERVQKIIGGAPG